MNNKTEEHDVLGQAVYDFHQSARNKRIKILSSITEGEYIDSEYLFRAYKDMPKLEKEALKICSGKILDVGACAGVHTLYLQQAGMDVTALEQSALCCKVMQDRGVKQLIHSNFYDFKAGIFDTILLLMNGIGIAGGISKLENFLNHCKSLLSEGGKIIFDSSDISYMFEEEDGSQWFDLNSEYFGEVNYQFAYKKQQSEIFDWLFLDFEMAKLFAERTGFNCKLIHEGDHFDYLATLELEG